MNKLVLHPATRAQLEGFIDQPSYALILTGAPGSGKSVLAVSLAEAILSTGVEWADFPYKLVIGVEDGKAIGIDQIRRLEHFQSLKVPRDGDFKRAVIIDDAHLMTQEAQNALLKTLEEPAGGTLIILNAAHEQSLLPTVRSRAAIIAVRPPLKDDLLSYFEKQTQPTEKIQQAYASTGGLAGLMHAILNNESHPLLEATKVARQLLTASAFEKQLMADDLSKQKQTAIDVLSILQQMAHISLQQAEGQAARKWQKVLAASFEASEELKRNAQPKLVLTRLCLSL